MRLCVGFEDMGGSSRLPPQKLLHLGLGRFNIVFAIDHMALVDNDGRYLDDAQALGVGDALISVGQTLLQAGAAGLQTLLCQSCRLLRVGGQIGR